MPAKAAVINRHILFPSLPCYQSVVYHRRLVTHGTMVTIIGNRIFNAWTRKVEGTPVTHREVFSNGCIPIQGIRRHMIGTACFAGAAVFVYVKIFRLTIIIFGILKRTVNIFDLGE